MAQKYVPKLPIFHCSCYTALRTDPFTCKKNNHDRNGIQVQGKAQEQGHRTDIEDTKADRMDNYGYLVAIKRSLKFYF